MAGKKKSTFSEMMGVERNKLGLKFPKSPAPKKGKPVSMKKPKKNC